MMRLRRLAAAIALFNRQSWCALRRHPGAFRTDDSLAYGGRCFHCPSCGRDWIEP